MDIHFPYLLNNEGRTAAKEDYDAHIRNLIEQVLFTSPGERVNRPNFGSGLLQLTFEPNSNELVATIQFLVQGALNQWLGDRIEVQQLEVENEDTKLMVTLVYTVIRTRETHTVIFSR